MQINPHFLFNTLNAGVQLAMLEGAERTSGFLDDIARIFRYNVKSLSRKVKIKEEIDTVRAYGNLFHVRFGDIIRFSYNIDCSLLNIDVPPLIIQPLVENAAIHGVGNLEQGGTITITLEQGPADTAHIIIEDNGEGMDDETRRKILNGHSFESEKTGHTTGIGVYNVVQRLRLFFGVEDVIDIDSTTGRGTRVTLKIPCRTDAAQPSGETADKQ
jgi:sensor histidine kinase YesM